MNSLLSSPRGGTWTRGGWAGKYLMKRQLLNAGELAGVTATCLVLLPVASVILGVIWMRDMIRETRRLQIYWSDEEQARREERARIFNAEQLVSNRRSVRNL